MTRNFKLLRIVDVSGISGTGIIAEGTTFSDGTVVLHWLGDRPTTTIMSELAWVIDLHGHGGKTRLVWDDDRPDPEFNEKDVEFLHDLLSLAEWAPVMTIHAPARKLLAKVRAAMGRSDQSDPVRT
jgi:hypothetical protein